MNSLSENPAPNPELDTLIFSINPHHQSQLFYLFKLTGFTVSRKELEVSWFRFGLSILEIANIQGEQLECI